MKIRLMGSYAKKFGNTEFLGDKTRFLQSLSTGKVIAHLGCTDWPNQIEQISNTNLLHIKILEVAKRVVGVDVDVDGLNHLQQLYSKEDFIFGDISTSSKVQHELIEYNPDYLLIPDVLEHIENSRDFLVGIKNVLSRADAIGVFTTPNAFALKTYIPVFFKIDFTHPDHCSIHNEFTIAHSMNDAGLKILRIGYLSRDISNRYGFLIQILTKPLDWFCKLFPRFSDTLYVEVTATG
jgi:hypothetical protein